MVRIRLRRVGRKKQPSYRIVVADSRSPRDGRYIEVIGFYNPRTQPTTMTIKEDRALHWLSNGAQPSDPVRRILDKLGTLARFERLRQGEPVEALVEEAEQQFAEAATPSPRTSYPAQEIQRMKAAQGIATAKAPQPAAQAEEQEEPQPVAQAEEQEEPQPAAQDDEQEEPPIEPEAAAETEEAVEAEALADVKASPTPEAAAEAAERAEETESLPDADSEAKPEVDDVGETTEEKEPPPAE